MNEELRLYQVEPASWWKHAQYRGLDAYETMHIANKNGWHEIPSWGRDGWDLGSWPLVIVYFRYKDNTFQVAEYVEGDITQYNCPTAKLREQITDEIAFFHWCMNEEAWVRNIETFDDLPEELKGPYRP